MILPPKGKKKKKEFKFALITVPGGNFQNQTEHEFTVPDENFQNQTE